MKILKKHSKAPTACSASQISGSTQAERRFPGPQHGSGRKEAGAITSIGRRSKTRQIDSISDERMPTLMGKYKVPHFDGKGEADAIFTELGVPTTFLVTSFYWENFIHFGMGPKKGADGKLAITLPMGNKKLASIAVEDIGKTAYAIFEKGDEMIGRGSESPGDIGRRTDGEVSLKGPGAAR